MDTDSNDILDLIGEDVLEDSEAPKTDCSEAVSKLEKEISTLTDKIDSFEKKVDEEPEVEAEVVEEEKDEEPEESEDKKDLITWEELGGQIVITKEGIKLKKGEYPLGAEPQKKESEYPAPESISESENVEFISSSDSKSFNIDGRTLFYDSIEFDSESSILEDGKLTVDAVIAKEIVQEYDVGGKKIKVYKPADELKKSADILSVYPRPVTDEHPATKVVTSADEFKGFTSNVSFVENSIPCKLNIRDKAVIDEVQTGDKRDVSIGFYSEIDNTPGKVTIDGKEFEYDAIQRNILIDHVAITKEGRCSTAMGCGIKTDSLEMPQIGSEIKKEMDRIEGENKILRDSLSKIESTETVRLKGRLLALTDYFDEKLVNDMPLSELKEKVDFVKGLVSDRSIGVRDRARINYREELDKVLE